MYDIQFVIPVSNKGKYKKRIEDFINFYGIYNIKNRKVKIYFLIGTETIEEIKKNDVDIEFIKSKNDNPVVKVYEFFLNMTKEQAEQANWTAKIDDDCFNDIDEMINILNEYDYNEKQYLVAGPRIREDLHPIEIQCIKNSNLEKKIGPNIVHELEACWVSKKTMTDIVENEDCKSLFKERIKYEEGHTDQCLALAAKITKAPLQKEIRFYADLTENSDIIKNVLRNIVSHYHPVCHDRSKIIYQLILNKTNNIKNEKFEEKSYIVRFKNDYSFNLVEIKLKEFGVVEYDNNLIDNWVVMDDKLILLRKGMMYVEFNINELIENKKAKNEFFSIYEVV